MKVKIWLLVRVTAQSDDPEPVGDDVASVCEDFLRSAGWPSATVTRSLAKREVDDGAQP